MIHYLKIKNFYSIKDEQKISFVEKSGLNNHTYLESAGEKVSKLNLFVGSNASGKTNILKVFAFIKWLICNSFIMEPNAILPYKAFFDTSDNSVFEICFAIEETIFIYNVEFSQKKIIKESLSSNSLVSTRRTSKVIFDRTYSEKEAKYIFSSSSLAFVNSEVDALKRQNASVLSIGVQFSDPQCMQISDYWRKININVSEIGYVGNNPFETLDHIISFHLNPEEKKDVEKILQKFDLGFDSLDIKTEQDGDKLKINSVQEIHTFGEKNYKNDISYSSNGTKRLLLVIRLVLFAINTKSPLIFDELEAFLHPEILREIIDIFIDEDVQSQLIFTSHSLQIMNKLDKNQIFFAEKNLERGSTEIYKLNEISGVRPEENFYNKYIAGAYGALPRL